MAKNGTGSNEKKLFVVGNHNDPGDENDAKVEETPDETITAYPFRFTIGLGVLIKDSSGKVVGEQDLQPLTVYDQDDAIEVLRNIEPQQVSDTA